MQWHFVTFFFFIIAFVCPARNIKTAAAFANWLAPKKGALLSLIYFFGSFCVYDIPHNCVIPQAMPQATPQTRAAFTLTVFYFRVWRLWRHENIMTIITSKRAWEIEACSKTPQFMSWRASSSILIPVKKFPRHLFTYFKFTPIKGTLSDEGKYWKNG